jgi:hypothetical protein
MHPKNCPLPLPPVLHSPTLAVAGATVRGAVVSSCWRIGNLGAEHCRPMKPA